MGQYAGKKAVIVGGTHGMGLATARALLEGGAQVVVTGRNEHNVAAAATELGTGAHVLRSDITSAADREALGALVEQRMGRIDLAFINAGVAELEPFEAVTEESFDRQFAVNARGAFFSAQRLAGLVNDGGAVVFTTVAQGPANPNIGVYTASKAAIRALSQAMAAELAERRVRVNTVGPGFIDTPTMGVADLSDEARAGLMKLGDEITPLGRHGTADEVARAVLFLAFDATFSTGIEVSVDGGLTQVGAALEA